MPLTKPRENSTGVKSPTTHFQLSLMSLNNTDLSQEDASRVISSPSPNSTLRLLTFIISKPNAR